MAGVFLFCAQISERAFIVARDYCTYYCFDEI
jgi:hypothetical protein